MLPIDAARCISGRDLTEPRLSPDGALCAYVTSGRSGAVICTVPTAGGPERQLTSWPTPRPARGLGGGCFVWMPDGSAVVYTAVDGDLWLQPLGSADPVRITRHGRSVSSPTVAPNGTWIGYVVDDAEVWATHVGGGRTVRLDDGGSAFCADPQAQPCSTRLTWVGWSPPHMPWDSAVLHSAGLDGGDRERLAVPGSVQQPRFLPDGRTLSVRDDTGWLNVWLGDAPLVRESCEHAGPWWGPGQRSYAVAPDGRRVAVARNEDGFGRLCVIDIESGTVVDIARGVHGALDWQGNVLVAIRTGARTPTSVVAHDMSGPDPTARRILAVAPVEAWDGEPALVEPEMVVVTASDGAVLHGRLYRSPVDSGRLICWVHGGPTDQWQVTFMPRLAYWVSRGWSVLVPDHRGSTGHGRTYQQALNGRWGELDVGDTTTLLRAVQAGGDGRPEATVVMGSSAGGMTALLVAARHPDLVRCAAVSYPVCDIAALDDTTHRFEAHYNDVLVGPRSDPSAVAARRDRSPLAHAAEIARVPVLVLHGDADPVVPLSQSEALVDAVRAAGGEIELVVYPGEGHGFRQPQHQIDDYRRTEAFLARHVG